MVFNVSKLSGPSSPMVKILINLLKLSLAIALFYYMIASGRLDFSLLIQNPLNAGHAVGLVVLLFSMLLQAIRWYLLLRFHRLNISLGRSIVIIWLSNLVAQFLPGAAAGDVVRGYYIYRNGTDRLKGFATILIDRFLSLFSLLIMGAAASVLVLVSAPPNPALQKLSLLVLALLGMQLIFIVIILVTPLDHILLKWRFERLAEVFTHSRSLLVGNKKFIISIFSISLLSNLLDTFSYWVAALALGLLAPIHAVFIGGPLVTLSNTLPLTPGGAGIAEMAADFVFGFVGLNAGAAIMLLTRLWSLILRLPALLIFLLPKSRIGFARAEKMDQ